MDEKYRSEREKAYRQRLIAQAVNTVTIVSGELADAPILGAGIIVGRDKDLLYVVTANHVVRRGNAQGKNLQIALKSGAGKSLAARLLSPFDPQLDLAVLGVPDVDKRALDVCSELRLLPTPGMDTVKQGTPVYPVGNPNGLSWVLPALPDAIVQVGADRIIFQSTVLSAGHSGGGLFTDHGSLVGMIINDAPPFGTALAIGKIRQTLRKWAIPVQLRVGYRELPMDSVPAFPVETKCTE